MNLDGGNLETLFEINNQTTVIGGFVGWAGPVGTINYCEKTDRVFFIASRSSTAEFRRLCSVNYQNLDLQFHASGSMSFGLTASAWAAGLRQRVARSRANARHRRLRWVPSLLRLALAAALAGRIRDRCPT
jgi:hypothetical protein